MRNAKRFHRRRPAYRRKSNAAGFRSIFLTFLLFSVLVIIITHLPASRQPTETLTGTAYVIDGDTVALGRTHVRLKGMDAPEMGQSCRRGETGYRCGQEARAVLRGKIGSAPIRCDGEGHDQYKRVLARCFLGETELNRWMVRQGWAVAYGDYRAEESEARRAGLGLWAGSFETPSAWRREQAGEQEERPAAAPAIAAFFAYIRERIDALFDLL